MILCRLRGIIGRLEDKFKSEYILLKKSLRNYLPSANRQTFTVLSMLVLLFMILAGLLIAAIDFYLKAHRNDIFKKIALETGIVIDVGELAIDWRIHRPRLRLKNVTMHYESTMASVEQLAFILRVRESIMMTDLRLRGIEVEGLKANVNWGAKENQLQKKENFSIADFVSEFRKVRQKFEDIIITRSFIAVVVSTSKTYNITVDHFDLTGTVDHGETSAVFHLDKKSTATIQGDWEMTDTGAVKLISKLELKNFPAPLLHMKKSDFDLIPIKNFQSRCDYYVNIPCLNVESATLKLALTLSDNEQNIAIQDIELHNEDLKGQADVKIIHEKKENQTTFDINVKNAQGHLETVLAVLPSEWLGLETYKWLIAHLRDTSAMGGLVKIKGSTRRPGFDEFLVQLKANAAELFLDAKWPSLTEIEALVEVHQDSLGIDIRSGRFDGLPFKDGKFTIQSFEKEPVVGEVAVQIKPRFDQLWSTLKHTPINSTITGISQYIIPSGKAEVSANIKLGIDFSDFETRGINYDIQTTTKELTADILEPYFQLSNANLRMAVKGRSVDSNTRIDASFSGISKAGLWPLGENIFGQIELNVGEPAYGLKLGVNSGQEAKLPSFVGLDIKTDSISGQLSFERNKTQKYLAQLRARFHHIDVPQNVIKKKDDEKSSNAEEDIDPRVIPGLDIEIGTLKLGDVEPGSITIYARKDVAGLRDIAGKMNGHRFSGEILGGEWIKLNKGGASSSLRGHVAMDETGKFLNGLGVFSGLNGGKSTAAFGLRWPGAPHQFSLKNARGDFGFHLIGGELVSMDSPFIKLMDVLTLKNFKINQKGAKIERAEGTLKLEAGKIKMDLVELNLSSSIVRLKGDINVPRKEIATDVGIETKIGGVVGVAAAGAVLGPAGAILGYLAADNFKLPGLDQLNKLTAFSYRLEGPWEEPKVSAFKPSIFGK